MNMYVIIPWAFSCCVDERLNHSPSQIVNIVGADDLATQRARASATMILTWSLELKQPRNLSLKKSVALNPDRRLGNTSAGSVRFQSYLNVLTYDLVASSHLKVKVCQYRSGHIWHSKLFFQCGSSCLIEMWIFTTVLAYGHVQCPHWVAIQFKSLMRRDADMRK